MLFSGDYQEDTLVYRCDPIRARRAKIALIDCAHRETEQTAEELRRELVQAVLGKVQEGKKVILPVPQFGRGLELLVLMRREFPNLRIRVDRDFEDYAKRMLTEPVWYFAEAYDSLKADWPDVMEISEEKPFREDYDILLLADTHLKKQKNVDFIHHQLQDRAAVLINGRVKKNGPAGKLLEEGKAERFLFPHHQSYGDLKRAAAQNQFDCVLPFHNPEKEILFFH